MALRTHGVSFALAFSALGSAAAQDFPDEYFYSGADRSTALKSLEGKPAPELSLDTWIGEETSLADLKGKVVIVTGAASGIGLAVSRQFVDVGAKQAR